MIGRLNIEPAPPTRAKKHPAVVLSVHWPGDRIPHAIIEGDVIDLRFVHCHNEHEQGKLRALPKGERFFREHEHRRRIRRDCESCVLVDSVALHYPERK
jgi:hypothetical protein